MATFLTAGCLPTGDARGVQHASFTFYPKPGEAGFRQPPRPRRHGDRTSRASRRYSTKRASGVPARSGAASFPAITARGAPIT